jgi:thiol-disulfide isomerase/thioredoxin
LKQTKTIEIPIKERMDQIARIMSRQSLLIGVVLYAILVFVPVTSNAETVGVGVALGQESGDIVVKQIITNSPAYFSNSLKVNDVIVAVAEEKGIPWNVAKSKVEEVTAHLRGTEGTLVRISIIRKTAGVNSPLEVSLVRAKLEGLIDWGDGNLISIGNKTPLIEAQKLSPDSLPVAVSSKSNVIVLYFWATWCGPCIEAWDAREKLFDSHPDWTSGVEHWNISLDADVSEVRKFFAKRTDLGKDKVLWAGPKAANYFHVNSLPTTYVISTNGSVLAAGHLTMDELREVLDSRPERKIRNP